MLKLIPVIALFTCFTMSGCSGGGSDGTSSGGGGFVDDNSRPLLQMVSRQLALEFRRSAPGMYKKFPAEWTQDRMATVIENIRYSPRETTHRHDRELIFDYGVDNNGPFLKALKPFFTLYAIYPIKFSEAKALNSIVDDLKLKILHELAHLVLSHPERLKAGTLNVGDAEKEANEFGLAFMKEMARDIILCEAPQPITYPSYSNGDMDLPNAKKISNPTWIIHRSSGAGLFYFAGQTFFEPYNRHEHPLNYRSPEAEASVGMEGCLFKSRSTSDTCRRIAFIDWDIRMATNNSIEYVSRKQKTDGPDFFDFIQSRDPLLHEELAVALDGQGHPVTAHLKVIGSSNGKEFDAHADLNCRPIFEEIKLPTILPAQKNL